MNTSRTATAICRLALPATSSMAEKSTRVWCDTSSSTENTHTATSIRINTLMVIDGVMLITFFNLFIIIFSSYFKQPQQHAGIVLVNIRLRHLPADEAVVGDHAVCFQQVFEQLNRQV